MSAAAPIESAPTTTAATPAPATPAPTDFPSLKVAAEPTPAAPPAAPPAPAWVDGLSADEKAYIASKGWDKEGKGPGDILKSYRNLERLRGVEADRLAKIPDWSKPEEVAEFRARLGVPESPDKYESPEVALPSGVLDASMIAPISHELGLTQPQHAQFIEATGKLLTDLFTKENEAFQRRDALERQALDKELGTAKAEFVQNVEAAKAAFKDVLTPQVVEALTASGEVPLLRVLGALGARLKEHRPPTNGTPANVLMTSEVAKARMAQLRTDKAWMQSHADGDTAKRTEWAELQRIAFGE